MFLPCELASSASSVPSAAQSFPPPDTTNIIDLAFGANHTVTLIESNDSEASAQVWGTGDGRGGQLGELTTDFPQPGFRRLSLPPFPSQLLDQNWHPTKIAASWTTTFIAFRSAEPDGPGLLLAMGTNDFAELANGQRGPAGGSFRWHVFEDEQISRLVAGPRHVLIVVEGRGTGKTRVLGWGSARHGQLSSEPLRTITSPQEDSKTTDSDPLGSSTSSSPPLPPPPQVYLVPTPLSPPGPSPTQVALGLAHSLLLCPNHPTSSTTTTSPSSTLHILGRYNHPATSLSLPSSSSPSSSILQIASTWSASIVLTSDPQTIHLFPKSGGPITLALPKGREGVGVRVKAGSEHVLVLLEGEGEGEAEREKEVWGWGWNEHGNMGDGTTGDWKGSDLRRVWTREDGEDGEGKMGRVVDCWAGNGTSWVLVER